VVRHGKAIAILFILVSVLLCGNSCGSAGQGEEGTERKPVPASDMIGFSASFAIEAQELVLNYEVTNRDRRDIYLINRLYRSMPVWDMSANVIYVHLDAGNQTVWLNKKIPDIPKDVLVNSPVAPFITPVRAGSDFREEVRIPLPLQDYRQYGHYAGGPSLAAFRAEPERVNYKRVYFTLGYYWPLDGTKEEIRNIQGTEVVFPIAPQQSGFPEFGELQSEVERLDIPVLEFREP
jgi:hypothetical protein